MVSNSLSAKRLKDKSLLIEAKTMSHLIQTGVLKSRPNRLFEK
jgi:hypothetical protein